MYFIKKMIGSSLPNNLVDILNNCVFNNNSICMSLNVSHHATVLDF